MKILEAQSATLTNYEVNIFLLEQKTAYHSKNRRGPSNYETIRKELEDYLKAPPSPLGDPKLQWDDNETMKKLLTRLRPYELTKAEVLMIINHRPTKVAALDTIVQELLVRVPDENEQENIAAIIKEVLGTPGNAAAQREEMNSTAARERELDKELKNSQKN